MLPVMLLVMVTVPEEELQVHALVVDDQLLLPQRIYFLFLLLQLVDLLLDVFRFVGQLLPFLDGIIKAVSARLDLAYDNKSRISQATKKLVVKFKYMYITMW